MSLESALQRMEEAEKIAVITHHNADLDSLCPALVLGEALRGSGKEVTVGAAESVSKKARQISEGYEIEIDPDLSGYDLIVTLDAASPEQLEPMEPDYGRMLVIDHHERGELAEKAEEAYVDSSSMSTTHMVYDLVSQMDVEITPGMAELLIAGIVGETSYLRYAEPETFSLIGDLLDIYGDDYSRVLDKLSVETDISEKIAVLKSVSRMDVYRMGDHLATFSTAGAFEASAARSMVKMGADFAIVASPRSDELRISGRMNWDLRERFNMATDLFEPCEDLIEGSAGGHDAAASANGSRPDKMGEVFGKMLGMLEEELGESAEKLE